LKNYLCLLVLAGLCSAQTSPFKSGQLRHARVREAFAEKQAGLAELLTKKGLRLGQTEVFLRAYKQDWVLEAWGRTMGSQAPFQLLKTYPFCAFSGQLGPKRAQGDYQIPEGFYHLNHFNPTSNFHLSLGISYPNRSDQLLATARDPGDAIYIHGGCVTIGCIPLTDEGIKELYVLCIEARQAGQATIPVHIFPTCLSDPDWRKLVASQPPPAVLSFWQNLKTGHDHFATHQQLPRVRVDAQGRYLFN
jgi:murein L,D-transpeptidase YafK